MNTVQYVGRELPNEGKQHSQGNYLRRRTSFPYSNQDRRKYFVNEAVDDETVENEAAENEVAENES